LYLGDVSGAVVVGEVEAVFLQEASWEWDVLWGWETVWERERDLFWGDVVRE